MAALKPMPDALELLKLLDAVYDVGQSRSRWFTGLLEAFLATFGRHAGVGGILYDISASGGIETERIKGLHIAPNWRRVGLEMHRDPRLVPAMIASYRSTLCATLSELTDDPSKLEALQADYHDRFGIRGQIMVNGVDCSGKGCAVFIFSPARVTLSDVQREVFSRLATHLATAYRLHRKADGHGKPDDAEAILTPGGRVEHAAAIVQGAATRQHLTRAVQQRERIRHADKGTERVLWRLKGLVEARWTLVDHYERGGQRYVLARENAPKPPSRSPAPLSERERQVAALAALGRSNKLITYELGLAHATVRVLMARACAKLRVKTRTELIAKEREPAGPGGESGPPFSA